MWFSFTEAVCVCLCLVNALEFCISLLFKLIYVLLSKVNLSVIPKFNLVYLENLATFQSNITNFNNID